MSFFQPWLDAPELQHLEPARRQRLWLEVGEGLVWKSSLFLFFFVVAIGSYLTAIIYAWHLGETIGRWIVGVVFVVGPPLIGLGVRFMMSWQVRRAIRQLLMREYAGKRLPVCFACGYQLEGGGDQMTACPECGNHSIYGGKVDPLGLE